MGRSGNTTKSRTPAVRTTKAGREKLDELIVKIWKSPLVRMSQDEASFRENCFRSYLMDIEVVFAGYFPLFQEVADGTPLRQEAKQLGAEIDSLVRRMFDETIWPDLQARYAARGQRVSA